MRSLFNLLTLRDKEYANRIWDIRDRLDSSTKCESHIRRGCDERRELKILYLGAMHIPPHEIPPYMDYYIIHFEYQRFAEMVQKGYTPVPAERHPSLQLTSFGSWIIFRDGILMERYKALKEQDAKDEPINQDQLASIHPFSKIFSKVKEQIDREEFYARY